MTTHTFDPSTLDLVPLIPVLGRQMHLIPALGKWRQEVVWLGRKRDIRQGDRTSPLQSEDSVEVRSLYDFIKTN